jgi:hypothetical protein
MKQPALFPPREPEDLDAAKCLKDLGEFVWQVPAP